MVFVFTAFFCPEDSETIKYDFDNQSGFTTTLDSPDGTSEPIPDVLRDSSDEVPVSDNQDIVIVSDVYPDDDFRVMELEFTVKPEDDGDNLPTTVTVTFTLVDGTKVVVTREVSNSIM